MEENKSMKKIKGMFNRVTPIMIGWCCTLAATAIVTI